VPLAPGYSDPVAEFGTPMEMNPMSTSDSNSRRRFLQVLGLAGAGTALGAQASSWYGPGPAQGPGGPMPPWAYPRAPFAPGRYPGPAADEGPVASAEEALARLVEGNRRYVAFQSSPVNETPSRRWSVSESQEPFAVVFSCVDSRVPPELVFDRGLGDLLVIRTAGHVIDKAVLGSLEFGVAVLKIPLLVIMGHERCGAVESAIGLIGKNERAPASINDVVEGIRPAVERFPGVGKEAAEQVIKANTELTVARLKEIPIMAEAIANGQLKIVGAYYDLDTGVVHMLPA
jgi:carbonic anhydrase